MWNKRLCGGHIVPVIWLIQICPAEVATGYTTNYDPDLPYRGGYTTKCDPDLSSRGSYTTECDLDLPYRGSYTTECDPYLPYRGGYTTKCDPDLPYWGGCTTKFDPDLPYRGGYTTKCDPDLPYRGSYTTECDPDSPIQREDVHHACKLIKSCLLFICMLWKRKHEQLHVTHSCSQTLTPEDVHKGSELTKTKTCCMLIVWRDSCDFRTLHSHTKTWVSCITCRCQPYHMF